jgi:hypothetical protein
MRELRSSDFAILLFIYFLLCSSSKGRSRDSSSKGRKEQTSEGALRLFAPSEEKCTVV